MTPQTADNAKRLEGKDCLPGNCDFDWILKSNREELWRNGRTGEHSRIRGNTEC